MGFSLNHLRLLTRILIALDALEDPLAVFQITLTDRKRICPAALFHARVAFVIFIHKGLDGAGEFGMDGPCLEAQRRAETADQDISQLQEVAILRFLTLRPSVVAVAVVDQVLPSGDRTIFTQTAQPRDDPLLVNVTLVMLMSVEMNAGEVDRVFIRAEQVQSALDAKTEGCFDLAGVVTKPGEMFVRIALAEQDELQSVQVGLFVARRALFVFTQEYRLCAPLGG